VSQWTALLGMFRTVFTAPSFAIFTDLLAGWVLTPGRRTITRMLTTADPQGRRAHDAYHRFVRAGGWSMSALWRLLAVHAVARLDPDGVVVLDDDDSVYKKTGRSIQGAGVFRDAMRSTRNRVVYAWGLNLVVVTLRVTPSWGGCPLGLPINVRVHRKGEATTVALAAEMVREIAGWLPQRCFHLYADGAYASLVGADLPRTHVTSRLRRDAALYEPAPPRTGKRGRSRTKGERLPTPPKPRRGYHRLDRRTDRRTRPHGGTATVVPSGAVVRGLPPPADPRRRGPRPGWRPAGRLLCNFAAGRRSGRGRRRLRRPLVHRGDQPRRQAGTRRGGPAVVEGRRAGPRRRPVAVAAHGRVVLVSGHQHGHHQLAAASLVHPQAHPQLRRRARGTAPNPVAATNYRHVGLCTAPRRNPRPPTRHARRGRRKTNCSGNARR
jgi:hypothetical protein